MPHVDLLVLISSNPVLMLSMCSSHARSRIELRMPFIFSYSINQKRKQWNIYERRFHSIGHYNWLKNFFFTHTFLLITLSCQLSEAHGHSHRAVLLQPNAKLSLKDQLSTLFQTKVCWKAPSNLALSFSPSSSFLSSFHLLSLVTPLDSLLSGSFHSELLNTVY